MNEEWAPIAGYPNYAVSNYGRVRNRKNGVDLTPTRIATGYLRVQLWDRGKPRSYVVHRLVAASFMEEDISDKQIDHKNNVKTHNFIWNLQAVEASENVKLTYVRGRKLSGNKPVRIVETGQKFDSIAQCARHLDVKAEKLGRHIRQDKPIGEVTVRYI